VANLFREGSPASLGQLSARVASAMPDPPDDAALLAMLRRRALPVGPDGFAPRPPPGVPAAEAPVPPRSRKELSALRGAFVQVLEEARYAISAQEISDETGRRCGFAPEPSEIRRLLDLHARRTGGDAVGDAGLWFVGGRRPLPPAPVKQASPPAPRTEATAGSIRPGASRVRAPKAAGARGARAKSRPRPKRAPASDDERFRQVDEMFRKGESMVGILERLAGTFGYSTVRRRVLRLMSAPKPAPSPVRPPGASEPPP
jgi:hypothetical protein